MDFGVDAFAGAVWEAVAEEDDLIVDLGRGTVKADAEGAAAAIRTADIANDKNLILKSMGELFLDATALVLECFELSVLG